MGIWQQLMKTEFMSSEESDVDDDEEVLKVHDLPWRRDIVNTMFSALDIDAAKGKTAQSRRQMKRRVIDLSHLTFRVGLLQIIERIKDFDSALCN